MTLYKLWCSASGHLLERRCRFQNLSFSLRWVTESLILPAANSIKYIRALTCIYVVMNSFLRLAICFHFRRALSTKWERHLSLGLGVIIVLYGITKFFWNLFYCGDPRNSARNMIYHPEKCQSRTTDLKLLYVQSCLNLGTDIIFVSLPLRHIIYSRGTSFPTMKNNTHN